MCKWKHGLIIPAYLLISVFFCSYCSSQLPCTEFITQKIYIKGNEKAKEKIILFEAGLNQGESIPVNEFLPRIEKAEANLKRTGLFSGVNITYLLDIDSSCQIEITITLVENWLLFPTIILETVDRNFNVWWKEFNHDLNRLNYGLGVAHNNLTGIRDRLKGKLARGYSNKYEAAYYRSYLGKSMKMDALLEMSYIESRETGYTLSDSRVQFFSIPGENVQKRMYFNYGLSHRTNRENRWGFKNTFEQYKISDSLAIQSKDYLLDGSNKQQFIQLIFNRNYNNLNHFIEPTAGWYVDVTSRMFLLRAKESHQYWNVGFHIENAKKIKNRIRYQGTLQGFTSFIRKKMPFNLYTGIGTGEIRLDGYEFYLISGMDYILTRQSLYYKLFQFQRNIIKIFKDEPKIKVLISSEAVIRLGTGFVNDPYYKNLNSLANTSLASISAGLQFGINGILKLELNYSVNHRNEKGIYFHTSRLF
ncbi:MAG: BamA/TamA family outer membrane protein [Saprospiraceae bacterium]|nr:BamA/TamA family outer membrane protein [Saprospiraceae bacterium]